VPRPTPAPPSSVLTEIGWLAYFFVIFAVAIYAMNLFVVPHHFNETISIVLAGLIAGLAMIFTRAWRTRAKR
jgi:uncharacterized membrane protein